MAHIRKRKERAIIYQGQENIGEIIMQWEIPEFIKHDRGKRWYIIASVLGIALLAYAIISLNFLFAVIIIFAAIIMIIDNGQHPRTFLFSITDRGITIGPKYYSYKYLDNFWIIYEPPETKNLYFSFKGIIKNPIAISLENQNPLDVRDTLLDFVSEDLDQENELPTDSLRKLLKF